MENPYAYILDIRHSVCTPAQEALKQALVQLLREDSLQDITVKALCAHAFIARSTFYAYYTGIDEVLEDVENDILSQLVTLNGELMDRGIRETDEMAFFDATIALLGENKTALYTLLVSSPDYRFIKRWKDAMKYHFWARIRPSEGQRNVELVLEMTASAAIGAYTFWLTHPYEVHREGVYRLLSGYLKALDELE